ncbi:MAG TPA: hypothetical protein VEZ55_00765 [Chitinophagaceae bacterium]|jgi:hypothetical protein|nr:hypothetical protein [Chitinophagaceae bacterium]
MHEHFYHVAYVVYETGEVKSNRSCLLRSSKVPTLEAAKNHIRTHFLNDSTALITISQVSSISKEVYLQLGGKADAPLIKGDSLW